MRDLGAGETVMDASWGASNGVRVGQTVSAVTTAGERQALRVVGSLDEDDTGLLGGGILVANEELERHWDEKRDAFLFLTFAGDPDVDEARRGVDRVLDEGFASVESQDREEVKDAQAGQIASILGIFYALLALSIIVSLFGVVNTLTLSIHERVRELGMLRRDRHEPAPDPADGPLRGRDHRAHRRRARPGAGHLLRLAGRPSRWPTRLPLRVSRPDDAGPAGCSPHAADVLAAISRPGGTPRPGILRSLA
jgi:hypothetical protein